MVSTLYGSWMQPLVAPMAGKHALQLPRQSPRTGRCLLQTTLSSPLPVHWVGSTSSSRFSNLG